MKDDAKPPFGLPDDPLPQQEVTSRESPDDSPSPGSESPTGDAAKSKDAEGGRGGEEGEGEEGEEEETRDRPESRMSMASVVEAVMGTLPRRPAERPKFLPFAKKKAPPPPVAEKPFSMIQTKPKPKVVKTFPVIAMTDADEGKRPVPREASEPPAAVHLPGGQGGDATGGADGGLDGWVPLPVSQSMPDVVELVLQNRTKSGKLRTLNEKPKTSKNKNKKESKSEIKSENSSASVASRPDKSDRNDEPNPESTKRDYNEPRAETPVRSENENSIATIEESKFENTEVIPEPTKENGNYLVKTDTSNSLPSSRMSATPSAKSSASGQISAASSKRKRKINDAKHSNADVKSVKSVDTEIFGVPLHSADTKKSAKSLQSAGQKSDRSLQSAATEKSNVFKKRSVVLQSASSQKSSMSLQSAGVKQSGDSLQSAQSKRSLKSIESANAREYVISTKTESARESAKHLQSADTQKSVQSNLGSAGAQKSIKSLQLDDKKSDSAVQPTDNKRPDASTRSPDDKESEKPLESAKMTSQPAEPAAKAITASQEEQQHSSEREMAGESSVKSSDPRTRGDVEKSETSEATEENKTDADKLEEKEMPREKDEDNKGGDKTEEGKEISGDKDNEDDNKVKEMEIPREKEDKKDANKVQIIEISRERDSGNADEVKKKEVSGEKDDNKDVDNVKEEDKSGERDTDKLDEKEISQDKDDPSRLTDGSQDVKDNSDPSEDAKSKDENEGDREDSHKISAESPSQGGNKTDSAKLSGTNESSEDKEKDSGELPKSSSADAKKDVPPLPRISVPSSESQVFTVDIPLSFEKGIPRLQSPKLMSVETENGVERRRSLVSTTAEENYLIVHGKSPPRATSPSSHTSEAIPNSQGDQSPYRNHSQDARLNNASNPTNRRADITERDVESQSARNTKAGVDQSITADGAVGGTTGGKDSGGKSTAGSSSRSVPGEGKGVQGDALRTPHGVKASDERGVRVEYDTVTKGSGYEVDHLAVPGYGESYARRSLPSVREDVLVEALAESARSYSGDLSRPLRRGEYAMPFPDNPRGTSLSSVEVPEGSINTVSLAVSKNGSHVARPVRDHGGASLFDRFSTGGGSLWQKAPQGAPLVVKPSGVVYSREPKEYEDYLPRESKRPPLQRRGSLGRIAVPDYDYYDTYDDPPRQTWSKPKESRGSQTVRVKNEQPHHSILKKKAPEEKRDTRPSHRAEEHADVGPIIIASGLVPKNLESYTSEYQAALARNGHKGNSSNNGNHGPSGNGNGNGHHHTSGNGNGNGHYHTNGNNGYGTGGGNPYHSNGSNRTTNSRSYPVKERDHFQERYFDPPPSVTAPLIAPQPKQSVGDVFDRLHRNVKPEHAQRKPEIKPKPKPAPPATQKTNTANTKPPVSSTAIVKDPVDRASVVGSNSTTTTSASSKGSSGGGDVFTRLYENAPSRKRSEKPNESTRLLDVPEGVAVTDSAPKPKKTATKTRTARQGEEKGDAVINMPLLAPDIVVDDMGGSSPSRGGMGGSDGYRGGGGGGGGGDNTKLPIVMLQGFFRGPGDRSPHHRRPSMTVSELTLPPDLLDVTSVIRGALPVLPRPLAALCLTLNILLPGLGTVASGWMGLCWGRNRLSPVETSGHRFTSVVVTGVTGLVQLFTVTFFLVGWFWGVAWGILLVSIANKYANFLSEHRTSLTGAVTLEMLTVNAS